MGEAVSQYSIRSLAKLESFHTSGLIPSHFPYLSNRNCTSCNLTKDLGRQILDILHKILPTMLKAAQKSPIVTEVNGIFQHVELIIRHLELDWDKLFTRCRLVVEIM